MARPLSKSNMTIEGHRLLLMVIRDDLFEGYFRLSSFACLTDYAIYLALVADQIYHTTEYRLQVSK